MVTRGFTGRLNTSKSLNRLPPGQHTVTNFPVLSAGPTPRISTEDWTFTVKVGPRIVAKWNWAEFNALPQTKMTRDIHCVTTWSKFNTSGKVCSSTIFGSRQSGAADRLRACALV